MHCGLERTEMTSYADNDLDSIVYRGKERGRGGGNVDESEQMHG
jgi:hypothetical protein